MRRPFQQVDVFTATPYLGNPVAVVLEAGGLSTEEMARVARWTNLSETTFVLPPTTDGADYRVRIFTPTTAESARPAGPASASERDGDGVWGRSPQRNGELPFAGHPTIGTCHAWLRAGGAQRNADHVVQECAAGLILVSCSDGRLAFAAPPLLRAGPVEEALLVEVAGGLGIARHTIVEASWADNGPGWIAVRLASVDDVLALAPTTLSRDVGVVALTDAGDVDAALEVRAFFPVDGVTREDPVTGSLNASVAQWLLGNGVLAAPYVARQGTVLGRAGRVHVTESDGQIWIGGDAVTLVDGSIDV